MAVLPAIGPEQEALFARFRQGSTGLDPLDPPHFGAWNDDAPDELAELASLIHAADRAGDRFRMLALGAAPGEWAVRAERCYRMAHPHGDFRSINLEGDLDHVEMMKEFMARNGADPAAHEIRYQVVASRDGFAYFPIINPDVDWGAGLAAVADTAEALDANITMTESAKIDRIAANHGKPLEFRTVPAISLTTLLAETGEVDFLHCDIQGAEGDVFPDHLAALSDKVRICCIATHGRAIERTLIEAFARAGWTSEGTYPAYCTGEGETERVLKDGVFLWTNPRLFGEGRRAEAPAASLAGLSLDDASSRALIERYRATTDVFEPLHGTFFGGYNDQEPGEIVEIASVLASVERAGDRYRLAVLGAAPGEWAIKAERAYRHHHPGGDYRSINLEGDLEHYEMTKACLAGNGVSVERNEVRYQVIADRDGFAYFPIINAERDWGAGIAAVSDTADDLGDKISMNEIAIGDRIAANDGKPLEFRTVPAVSLATLLGEFGPTDLLHCDIQGAEREVFPAGMTAMNAWVKLCCIATHGKEIERILIDTFAANGWRSLGAFPCHAAGDGDQERVSKDGVFVWLNSALVGEAVAAKPAPALAQASAGEAFSLFGWLRGKR